jgi:hypothetical protein
MKGYVWAEVWLYGFLSSILHKSDWSDSWPGRCTSSTYSIEGWLGPKAREEILENRKISCPFPKLKHDSSVIRALGHSLYCLRVVLLTQPHVACLSRIILNADINWEFQTAYKHTVNNDDGTGNIDYPIIYF